ncbi:hypothetical protein IWZ00DRAFT_499665 [Phyllosticta capitalensis]
MVTTRRRCSSLSSMSLLTPPPQAVLKSPPLFKIWEVVTFAGIRESYRELKKRYTTIQSLFLLLILPSASGILRRVEENVISASTEEVAEVKRSLVKDFDMLAVAGAILAQVAMTALDLARLDSTHWTATGAFAVALVTGALTVVHSCLLQQRINSFVGPDDLKKWLSRCPNDVPNCDSEAGIDTRVAGHSRSFGKGSKKRASISAVFIINVPGLLLYYSVVSFLAGLGVYVVSSWVRKLDNFASPAEAFRVMILYIVTASLGVLILAVPVVLKMLESSEERRIKYQRKHSDFSNSSEMTTVPSSVSDLPLHSVRSADQRAARPGSFRGDLEGYAQREAPRSSLESATAAVERARNNLLCKNAESQPTETQRDCFEKALVASIEAQQLATEALKALLIAFQNSGDDRAWKSTVDHPTHDTV